MRKPLVALATVLVVVALASAASPSPVRAAQYTYPCSDFDNYKLAVARSDFSDYTGVIGDMKAQGFGTCTNTVGPVISAILPANLQVDNTNYIVQIGTAVCSGTTANKCGAAATGVPSDGALHFVYICVDNSGGVPCLADGWVGGPPEIGDRYRFRIDKVGNTWKYSVQNITEGWTSTKTVPRSSAFTAGNTVWWAAEAYDRGSMLGGGQAAASMINMYWMQYLHAGDWWVAWPNTQFVNMPPGVVWPAYWHGDEYNQNYTNDAQNIWTTQH